MKKLTCSFAILSSLLSSSTFAAAYQLFLNNAYDNPAALNSVQKMDFSLGDTFFNARMNFSGSNGPYSGTAQSIRNSNIPYFHSAYRVNPKFVVGLDVSSLELSNIRFPQDSVVRFASTGTFIHSFDISPRASYQILPNVALGAAFIADRVFDSELNFMVGANNLVNAGRDWAYGWAAGLSYMYNPQTFINLSYNSPIQHNLEGKSTWGGLTNTNFAMSLYTPAVASLNLTKFINPRWIASGTFRYVLWGANVNTHLTNTALGTIILPGNYNNSWNAQVATRYQINDRWAGMGMVMYESSPQGTAYRPVGLPTYKVWSLGLGPEYSITKEWSAKLLYGYAYSNPPINTTNLVGPLVGNMHIRVNVLDLSVSYKV